MSTQATIEAMTALLNDLQAKRLVVETELAAKQREVDGLRQAVEAAQLMINLLDDRLTTPTAAERAKLEPATEEANNSTASPLAPASSAATTNPEGHTPVTDRVSYCPPHWWQIEDPGAPFKPREQICRKCGERKQIPSLLDKPVPAGQRS